MACEVVVTFDLLAVDLGCAAVCYAASGLAAGRKLHEVIPVTFWKIQRSKFSAFRAVELTPLYIMSNTRVLRSVRQSGVLLPQFCILFRHNLLPFPPQPSILF